MSIVGGRLRATVTAAGAQAGVYFTATGITAGQIFSASAEVVAVSRPTLQVKAFGGFQRANGTDTAPFGSGPAVGPERRARVDGQTAAAQSTKFLAVFFGMNVVVGDWFEIDRVMVSQTPRAAGYIDGSMPGGTWTGAPNLSASYAESSKFWSRVPGSYRIDTVDNSPARGARLDIELNQTAPYETANTAEIGVLREVWSHLAFEGDVLPATGGPLAPTPTLTPAPALTPAG